MTYEFEDFDTTTGWSASGGGAITGLNNNLDYVAGDLNASLILEFTALNCYCMKTFTAPIDVTDYNKLTFHLFSQTKRNNVYRTESDFSYKIALGTNKEYYLICPETFCDINIDISDLTSIEYIKIIANHDDTDYLMLSYGVLSTDEMPLDIFIGIKKAIDKELTSYATAYPMGVITASAGATSVPFLNGNPFIDRYTAFSVGTETHLISRVDSLTASLSSVLDGSTIVSQQTATPTYLAFPVVYGRVQTEIILPSISIWGIVAEEIKIDNSLDRYIDCFKTAGTFKETKVGRFYSYDMMIDCEARTYEILTMLSRCTRNAVSKYQIWVNGRKINIDFSGTPVEIYPTEAVDIIPKIQYTAKVIVREDIFTPETLVKAETATLTVEVV